MRLPRNLPLWIDHDPDDDECQGLIVWDITRGRIDDVNVSDLRVASASFHTGRRKDSVQRVVLFIDKGADEAQRRSLTQVFSGDAGGPLAELGEMLGTLEDVQRAEISLTRTNGGFRVGVGRSVSVAAETAVGSTGRPIQLVDSALATVLGSPARVAHAERLRLKVPKAGLELDITGTSAMSGAFSYEG